VQDFERALAWSSPGRKLTRSWEQVDELVRRMHRAAGDHIRIQDQTLQKLGERLARSMAPHVFSRRLETMERVEHDLHRAFENWVEKKQNTVRFLQTRLQAFDPHAPLKRGYSLVRLQDGTYLRSPAQVRKGDSLDILVRDGSLQAQVTSSRDRER
jgi:exodeoxyribonuclease VII large subunit